MLLVHTSNNKVDTLEDLRLNQEGHLNSYWETSSEVELRQWFLLFQSLPKTTDPKQLTFCYGQKIQMPLSLRTTISGKD